MRPTMVRVVGLGSGGLLFVLGLGLTLLQCSGDTGSSKPPDQPSTVGGGGAGGRHTALAGNGGTAGTGTAGAAGSGGGSAGSGGTAAPDLFESCVTYDMAVCERYNYCDGTTSPCTRELSTMSCFGRFTAPGSVRTASMLLDCAQAWSQHSCELIAVGIPPQCVLPGTRTGGEACVWGNQCDSLRCSTPARDPEYPAFPGCGTCERLFGPDEDCTGEGVCPIDESCDAVTSRCVPVEVASEPVRPGEGQPCTDYCARGLTCLGEALQGPARCGKLPSSGACKYVRTSGFQQPRCAPGSYCTEATVCAQSPAAPAECGVEWGANTTACQHDNYCAAGANPRHCVALPSTGEPCVKVSRQFEGYFESSLESAQLTCAPGLNCRCSDDSCVAGTCVGTAGPGEACDGVSRLCVPGATCTGGQCVVTGETYDALCGAP